MKVFKGLTILAITIITSVTIFNTNIVNAASKFRDLKEDYWAYDSILSISNKGYIVGDSLGNFKPNDFIDKFETVKIFSRVSGYKYNNATAEELDYYKKVYDKNAAFINQFDAAFTKWNPTSDKEIAYLLEKEVLVSEDLNQFVVKTEEGVEKLRALSREECAMFIVKVLGQKQEALAFNTTFKYNDDGYISEATKPYVYYLKEKGVFTVGEDGNFNPKTAVTRAVMSTILDRALAINQTPIQIESGGGSISINGSGATVENTSNTTTNNANVTRIETLTGKVDEYFSKLTALQIILNDGTKKIYKISSSSTIYIDGYIKTVEDLKKGMNLVLVLNNSEIVDIKAQSVTIKTEIEPITNIEKSILEGTISSITADFISIQVTLLTPKGDIVKEVRTYKIDEELEITMGNTIVALSSLNVGDIVKTTVSTTTIYEIKLDEKDLKVKGTLLEKKYDVDKGDLIVIKTDNGLQYNLQVTDKSKVTRKGFGDVSYKQLRVGDTLDIVAEYDKIIDLYAVGTKTTVDGTLTEILIGMGNSKVTVKKDDGTYSTYDTAQGSIDVYSLKIGSKVRLRLDSLEIETINIISMPSTSFLTGNVSTNKQNTITIFVSDIESRDITYDKTTVFMDSFSGNRVESDFITKGMRVYVVLRDGSLSTAKTITVLAK